MNEKIDLLKKMQQSELSAIKGQHQRALARLKERQKQELESLEKKHTNALNISESRIVHLEKANTKDN